DPAATAADPAAAGPPGSPGLAAGSSRIGSTIGPGGRAASDAGFATVDDVGSSGSVNHPVRHSIATASAPMPSPTAIAPATPHDRPSPRPPSDCPAVDTS